MAAIRYKYPRTPHLFFSPGTISDDRLLTEEQTLRYFQGKRVVVSEKLDGSAMTLYRDFIHARSLDGRSESWQSWVRQLHGRIGHDIPAGYRVCGEDCYAAHSIFYNRLTSFFYVYSIWNEKNICLSWKETVEYAALLGLETVPVLYEGMWDIEKIVACWTGVSRFGDQQEGYVVRNAEAFRFEDFGMNCVKWVRPAHVQTTEHWKKTWVPNKLAE